MSEVVVEVMTITPAIAEKWLQTNEGNRRIRQPMVDQYARDMANGRWKVTGDSIKRNGARILDGQHRLLACVKAGVEFESVVATGVAEDAHAAIDGGAKRTFADELRWQGVGDPATTAAALNLLWRWKNEMLNTTAGGSKGELLDLLGVTDHVQVCVNLSRRVWEATRIPTTPTAAMGMAISEREPALFTEWTQHLARGTDYPEGDAALALRTYALKVQSTRALRPRQEEWLALSIKSFNAWATGTPIRILKWTRVGRGREEFPVLVLEEKD